MKISTITSDREYSGTQEVNHTVLINFNSLEDDIQSKALYYIICGIDKMNTKEYKDLDFMEKSQVDARLDAGIDMLTEMRKCNK